MWILPSQLLNSAPDMAVLDLDSKTSLASECEPSHIVSLRGSLKPISSVKWKKDSWMSHLYGTILKPSHTNRFTDWWTSSLRDTLANHFPAQESEQEKKTLATSGLGSQMEFDFLNQQCASLKTSKDTFRWDSPQSSVIWKNWVTKVRSEYSVRVKSAHLTNANECSSWPTSNARYWKDSGPTQGNRKNPNLGTAVVKDAANWPTASMSMTAGYSERDNCNSSKKAGHVGNELLRQVIKHGLPAPANPSTDGSRQGLLLKECLQPIVMTWATPTAQMAPEAFDATTFNGKFYLKKDGRKHQTDLQIQVKAWGTPTTRDHKSGRGNEEREYKELTPMVERTQNGKLSPRWVETLMGLPMGWTSPSCPASVIRNWPKFVSGWLKSTTAQTNYDPAETELFHQQQNEFL